MDTAADAVSEVLARSGLTKASLSTRSGVSRSLLDEYLKGIRQPSVAQLQRLGEAAGLRLDIAWASPDKERSPGWTRPNPAMRAQPLSLAERAQALELACGIAMTLPARERGPLEYPTFASLGADG